LKNWEKLSSEQKQAVEAVNPGAWAVHHVKRVDNHPFDIKKHPYLYDIFDDTAHEVVVRKSAQTRFSMTMIMRFIHKTAKNGWNGIYWFPTDEALYPFMQSRFDRLIELNPDLQALLRSTDNVKTKLIGDAFAYFFGMKSKTNKESTPADHETFDEYDLMNSLDVEIAKERMQDSPHKYMDFISTPTLPDFGIDALLKDSDFKCWTIKCDSCKKLNECDFGTEETPGDAKMIFPECIEQGFLACIHCLRPLDVLKGEWVAKYTENPRSGYYPSRLIVHGTDYVTLLEEFKKVMHKGAFYNRRLGLPYADSHARITKEQVLKLCGTYNMIDMARSTTMGIDVNPEAGHHYVVSRPGKSRLREIISIGKIKDLDDFPLLIRKWDVKKFVIDAQPDLEHARKLCDKFPGKGFMCYYIDSQKDAYKWDDDNHKVLVNRTESLDASQRLLREGLVSLPVRSPVVEDFADHCSNIAKQTTFDDLTGKPTVEYVKLGANKPDHYRHALNYDGICWYHGQGWNKPISSTIVPENVREMLES